MNERPKQTSKTARYQFNDREYRVIVSGVALDRCLKELYEGSSWAEVRRLIETGKVSVGDRIEHNPQHRLTSGAIINVRMNARKPNTTPRLDKSALVHIDTHVVVVRKPAGISTVPYDENETGTLDELVREALRARANQRDAPLGIVHRIDKETSGLVVFARTHAAKLDLKQQFRFHTVVRRYWALAHGDVKNQTITSRLLADRGDGLRGSTTNPKLGREATTHIRVLERLKGATHIECRLETGRTHQIRIHLAEALHPLLGDRVYNKNYPGPQIPAPRLMLHAFELGFKHPITGQQLHFEEPMPEDMKQVLTKLRLR